MLEGLEWLDDRFHLIRCQNDELPSIEWVLDLARAAVLRWAARPPSPISPMRQLCLRHSNRMQKCPCTPALPHARSSTLNNSTANCRHPGKFCDPGRSIPCA